MKKDNLNKRNNDNTELNESTFSRLTSTNIETTKDHETETETLDCSVIEIETWDYKTWDYKTWDYETWNYETWSYEEETKTTYYETTTDYEEPIETPGSNSIQKNTCKFLMENYVNSEMENYKSNFMDFNYKFILIKDLGKKIINKYNDIIKNLYTEIKCTDEMVYKFDIIIQKIKNVIDKIKYIKKMKNNLIDNYYIMNNEYLEFLDELLMNWDNNKCSLYYPYSTEKIKKEINKCQSGTNEINKFEDIYNEIVIRESNLKSLLEEILRMKKQCDYLTKCQLIPSTSTETTSTDTSITETTSTDTSITETITTSSSTDTSITETITTSSSTDTSITETITTSSSTDTSITETITTSSSTDTSITETITTSSSTDTTETATTFITTYCNEGNRGIISFDIENMTILYEFSTEIESEIPTDYEIVYKTETEYYTMTESETSSTFTIDLNNEKSNCEALKFEFNISIESKHSQALGMVYIDYYKINDLIPQLNKDYNEVVDKYNDIIRKCEEGITKKSLEIDIISLCNRNLSVRSHIVQEVIDETYSFKEKYKNINNSYLNYLKRFLNKFKSNKCETYDPRFTKFIESEIKKCNNINDVLLPNIEMISGPANEMKKECLDLEELCNNDAICNDEEKCSKKENTEQ